MHMENTRTRGLTATRSALVTTLTIVAVGCGDPNVAAPAPSGAPKPAPSISSIAPREGLAGLPMEVRITGSGFEAGARVTLDEPATVMVVSGGSLIRLMTPSHAPAVVDVTVTNSDGQSVTVKDGYAYRPVTLTVNPQEVAAGAEVSVSWVAPGRTDPETQGDWLGLFRPETSENDPFVWGRYSTGASGTFTVNAPTEPGSYELRYLAGDDHVSPSVVMARAVFVVK
jgi:hypothetical protein